jgi:hypothetical protein
MSGLQDAVGDQLRARLETVANDLRHVAQGRGAFSDPKETYLMISVSIGTLEVCLFELRRHGLV